jgi:propionyl-CoA carboxylase alpha chain
MAQARPITRLLVANRGEIARRVFRTARAMGLSSVAVYSEPDADAPFVRDADSAVPLGGATAADSYLQIAKVLSAARRAGADAVHPGYGFLSENPDFARAVIDAGLIWVGPPPDAIAVMGDKLTALDRMRSAGVPTLPRAEIEDGTDLNSAAERVGYPLLVKASAGGGGKGMRVVSDAAMLAEEVAAARREALKAFGSDVVYLEHLVSPARHIEVQVIADQYGTVRHLFERECSIQRRHQKVVEESPAPTLDHETRDQMYEAAVTAAASVGYVGAGTVEFVVDADAGFSFLEMNTRLQVEHPVSECVTGVDLVRLQLLVAQGEPLSAVQPTRTGSAIEVRLYAEDPTQGFLPASGRVTRLIEPCGVRIDAGVVQGDLVSVHYDPMLAKIIAHAPTRREAAAALARALSELRVHGLVTNREFLARVLRHPDFLAGDTTTDFIDRHLAELLAPPDDDACRRAAVAAALTSRERRLAQDPARLPVPPGWRNNRSDGEHTTYAGPRDEIDVAFQLQRDGTVSGTVSGSPFTARLWRWDDPWLDLELDGLRTRATVSADGASTWVQDEHGEVQLVERPRFPEPEGAAVEGGLTAPMNGTVVSVAAQVGERVSAKQTLLVVEAMKMEHRMTAPADGVVEKVLVASGDAVAADQLLLVLAPDDPAEA